MDFDAPPTSLSMDAMKKEADSIMKPTGVKLNWRLLKDNHGNEGFAGLVVVRFKGKCRVQPWDEPGTSRGSVALGKSLVSDGNVLPFSEVECDQVRKTVVYDGDSPCELEKQSALGRAMGRVVAHELYHVLANTTGHAARGLAKASQSFRDLVTGSLGFQAGESQAIQQGVTSGSGTFSFSSK